MYGAKFGGVFGGRGLNGGLVFPPIRDKLLLTLRPYAYGEDVPIVGYMIPESMQAEMFAIFGEGLWFDGEGIAKQVNIIELAQSPEINLWAVWYRLDAAAGLGKREVLFYDPDLITVADVAKIAAFFKHSGDTSKGIFKSILHFDATKGFTDQTGRQSVSLIGTEYPSVVSGFAINESGREWEFVADTGRVHDALSSGEVTLVQVVSLPLMSTLTDATDYSLFGDLLFVRRDGTAGSFKASDGTNTATVAYDWDDGEVVRVVMQADSDVMRVGVV